MRTNRKAVYFTAPGKAEFIECEISEAGKIDVLVRNEFTVISGGTERANILGGKNVPQGIPVHLVTQVSDML